MNINNIISRIIFLVIGVILACNPIALNALSLTSYSENSVLSEGNWVKISIPQSGIYLISNSDLQKWGFSDPSKVHIYGYGGKRIPDVLNSTNYTDDLPIVQSQLTGKGIVFYAQGPETWTHSNNKYTHSLNPFSTHGYYFISDREVVEVPEIVEMGKDFSQEDLSGAATTFIESLFHEKDLVNHGETGHLMVGEDFKYTNSQTFKFPLPDIDNSQEVWMECSFVAKTVAATTNLTFTANGITLQANTSDKVPASSESAYIHGKMTTTQHSFNISGSDLSLGIRISSDASIQVANLNYITLNYTRKLNLLNGLLKFRSRTMLMTLTGANSDTHIWDVTKPDKIHSIKTQASGNSVSFKNNYSGFRDYVAWNENASIPSPTFVGKISNQNIHNLETPDMVIITVDEWSSQAERIANLHRNSSDSLNVLVLNQDQIFNEFGSGAPDVNALRRMLKMFWDRGEEGGGRTLKYALLFGRGTYDNRHLSSELQKLGYKTIPLWQSDKGLDDNESFCTDDILAFLKDGSGSNFGSDHYCIAVGRIPVRSESEAKTIVDKLYRYVNSSEKSEWKNQILLVADDMDNGVHMEQTEAMWEKMSTSPDGKDFIYNKLYIDAFTREGNSYPQAKSQMFRLLEEGTIWWNYVGHANTTSWTHDGLLSYTEMSSLYLKKYPFLYAATCDYLRWDANATSGAEVMHNLSDGGIIGAISATRPVYIANNGLLSTSLAPYILKRDENGNTLPVGVMLQNAKNNFYNNGSLVQDRNKLRFALMGDPALRLSIPSSFAKVSEVNGAYVDLGEQVTVQARENIIVKGFITDYSGKNLTDFNGIIHSTLYDAEKSTISHGYEHDDDGKEIAFDEHGSKLYAGRDSVINGEFTLRISMPTEIANNYREATLNLYAQANNGYEAIGCNRSFYVYGFDESSLPDTIAPEIEYLYLNHEDFANGDVVNESPMLIAKVSDNVSINLSSAGVGHQMSLRLDGDKNYSDVALYYTPIISDISSGIINYPIDALPDGNHEIRLKVWDTSGNSTEKSLTLQVKQGTIPNMFDVYTDANPAHTETNFYIKHDRPNTMATVTIEVFNLMGQLVWSSTKTAQSDMFISSPINWDLRDLSGRRVNRGIYVYRASISTDGVQYNSSARKLAVAAQ